MNFRHLINTVPTYLAISPTHRCTASCQNCALSCSPNIKHTMTLRQIISYIDETLIAYPDIKIIVLTGGECFLLGSDLNRVIEYIHKKGRLSRVVTNAHWAKDYDLAYNRLKALRNAGLTELNISTGDEHQRFIPFQNVIHAINAAISLNLFPIAIFIEAHPKAKFTRADMEQTDALKKGIEEKKILVVEGAWMNFLKNTEIHQNFKAIVNHSCRCDIFSGIVINPYSQLLSCCGLTAEYNPYLKLGDLTCNTIVSLYEKQFEDLYKLWLYVDGPENIYNYILNKKGVMLKTFPHHCAYCIEIVRDESSLFILKSCIKDELSNILARINLLKFL